MFIGKDMINLRLIRNHLKIQLKDFLKNIEILFFHSKKKNNFFAMTKF